MTGSKAWDALRWSRVAIDAVALLGFALIQTILLRYYGIAEWTGNDGEGYVALAEQLTSGQIWHSVPDFDTNFLPISLLRLPGYPALIVLARWLAGSHWVEFLVAAQYAVATLAAYVLYRVVAVISQCRLLGLAVVLIFLSSSRANFDRYILTDSLNTSLLVILIAGSVWLTETRRGGEKRYLLLGAEILLILFLMREMSLVIAAAGLPLAVLAVSAPSRRQTLQRLAVVYAPLAMIVLLVLAWNFARTGYPIITTTAQVNAVYALSQVEKAGVPVFVNDPPLYQAAREHLKTYDYAETTAINEQLFSHDGLHAPEIAKIATKAYFNAWLDHPKAMFDYAIANLAAWHLIMLSNEIYESLESICQNFPRQLQIYCYQYSRWTILLYNLCVYVLAPLALIGILIGRVRRQSLTIIALVVVAAVPTIAYAVLHLERRHVYFTMAPLFLILALFLGECINAMRHMFGRQIAR